MLKMSNQILNYLKFLLEKKNFKSAKEESIKFLSSNPTNTEILNILGLSRVGLGQLDLAIECFLKALEIKNDNNLRLNLSFAYYKSNKKISAVKQFLYLINNKFINYTYFKLLYDLPKNLKNKKKILVKITDCFEKQKNIKIDSSLINFLHYFLQHEEFDFLQICCEKFLETSKLGILYNILGNAHFSNDNFDLAEKNYLEAKKLDKYNYSFYFDLAEFYKSKGSLLDAIENYKIAIKLDKNLDANLHRCYAYTKKYQNENDDHLQSVKKYLQLENLTQVNKMHLLFAASKAYDDLNKIEESYKYFSEANLIARSLYPQNIEYVKKEFYIFKNAFSDLDIKQNMQFGFQDKNYKPIFILGLPRSGSTLVEQILSNHSNVFSKGESKIFGRNLSYFFNTYDYSSFEKDFLFKIKNVKIFEEIGKFYIEKSIKQHNQFCFTDKMLFNFLYIGLIKICLPHSKIIICERDYRDIFVSIIKNYFTEIKMGFSYSEELIVDYINFYDEAIKCWKKKLGNLIFFTKYEELVENSESQIKKIFSYCDLPLEKNSIEFNKNKNFVKTLSNTQVRSGIYKSSVQTWKKYELYYSKIFTQLEKLNT